MSRSIIVFGPSGCGKTRNGPGIMKAYNLDTVVELDDANPGRAFKTEGVVYLTNNPKLAERFSKERGLSVIPFEFVRIAKGF